MRIQVVYSDKQVADPGTKSILPFRSPSSQKPKHIAAELKRDSNIVGQQLEFIEPNPLSVDDFKRCHDHNYVDSILNLQLENGFGTKSQEVVDSLPYTNGAMYDACRLATTESPACALVAGFHHAGYNGWAGLGYFCTFNGLMISAAKINNKVAIIDCDQHWGNGTDDILYHLPDLAKNVLHISFGKCFNSGRHAEEYLKWLEPDSKVFNELKDFKPSVIMYQAGADAHINDPMGGVLTNEQMFERDLRMFKIAKTLNIPIAWNLAGGYQVTKGGSIHKVIELHLNTFKACVEAHHD